MDIQAILAASDSSDESDHFAGSSVARYSEVSTGNAVVDIEQLLREDEEYDDEADDEDRDKSYLAHSRPVSRTVSLSSKYATFKSTGSDVTCHSHDPQDWAILQTILQGNDDNDEEDDAYPTSAIYSSRLQIESWMDDSKHSDDIEPETQNNAIVDAIINASDDESEHENDGFLPVEKKHMPEPWKKVAVPKTPTEPVVSASKESDVPGGKNLARSHGLLSVLSQATTNASNAVLITQDELESSPSLEKPEVTTARSNSPCEKTAVEDSIQVLSLSSVSATESFEEESKRALASALVSEHKLLKSGHRDIVSPLSVKRRLRPKVELTSRGNKNSTKATSFLASDRPMLTSINYQRSVSRFNFSGVTENKQLANVSTSLVAHADDTSKVVCGLPTAMALNTKFIAIGTQKGIILLYDLFEQLRQRLGHGESEDSFNLKQAGAVTSLDLNFDGDLICAGYSSGILVLWDSIRGMPLKSFFDVHPSPITSIRFLSELKVVTVDAGGIVNKITFTRNMIWLTYSLETECLLDGTAGQILAMSVLRPFSTVNPNVRAESLAPVLRKLTLIALSSERSSFTVAVDPSVNVLHRWARPSEDKMAVLDASDVCTQVSSTHLPFLAWGWALVSGGQNVVMPILARAWGCCLQLLRTSFPTADDVESLGNEQVTHWPAFGLHEEIDTHSPVVALQWLDDRSLVYLTVAREFTLIDTVMMTLLERIDFSSLNLVYAELTLSRRKSSVEDEGDASLEACSTYQNSVRNSDGRVVVLCCDEVRCISIVGAKRRVASLEEDGEWLEALALALDHYESTVISQEDRRRGPIGKRDPSHYFYGARSEDEEWIEKLLLRYVNLAVDNAPIMSPGSMRKGSRSTVHAMTPSQSLATSHFQMLAGVVMEYCVTTRRLDLLFGPIFQKFQSTGFSSVFFEVLEPYVLNDKVTFIAPETMSYFVQHCKAMNEVATVERCLLHLDCTMMDFDSLLHLLRDNEMFTALFYVYNQGLDDYISPLEVLIERIFEESDSLCAPDSLGVSATSQTKLSKLGYKAILYLQASFKGLAFPVEKRLATEDRQETIKNELLSFLAREKYVPSPQFKKGLSSTNITGLRAQEYPYVRILLFVDPKATFDTISLALSFTENTTCGYEMMAFNNPPETQRDQEEVAPSAQKIMDALSSMIFPGEEVSGYSNMRSHNLVAAFLDFTANYLLQKAIYVRKDILMKIFSRMANRFIESDNLGRRQVTQRQMLDLFSALPPDAYEPEEALALIDNAGIHRVALFLHQQAATSWNGIQSTDMETRSYHFKRAIDCYVGDHEEVFRKEVFDYVKKECMGLSVSTDSNNQITLRDALFEKLPALIRLDPLLAARLVAELFVDDVDRVVEALDAEASGKSLFKFLRVVDSGELSRFDPGAGAVLNLSKQHHEKYLTLMAKLHPELVYEYLSTHDTYRLEDCLKLCQKHDIADASAYLLERLGNVSSALQLMLQTLESRMMNLKRSIRGMGIEAFRKGLVSCVFGSQTPSNKSESSNPLGKDFANLRRMLVVALDLCERNTQPVPQRTEQGSQLWFNVLDRLMNAKSFLRLEKEQAEHAEVMSRVLSSLMHLTMQRMVSSVPLNDLVRKITSDSDGSRLGEMRDMIDSFIQTYRYELKVSEEAFAVLRQDVINMRHCQRRLASQGAPVRFIGGTSIQGEEDSSSIHRLTRLDVILSVREAGMASAIQVDGISHSKRVENGLVTAVARLRERRISHPMQTDSRRRPVMNSLNTMTVSDIKYTRGECEPVVYGPRQAGILGEAEHRGRLVTFG